MGLSALNFHRYHYNFINFPISTLYNEGNETTFHYFVTCPSHTHPRQLLFNTLRTFIEIDTNNLQILLPIILQGHHAHPQQRAE